MHRNQRFLLLSFFLNGIGRAVRACVELPGRRGDNGVAKLVVLAVEMMQLFLQVVNNLGLDVEILQHFWYVHTTE